ncbi:alpha/beta fold hydrolase [Pseudooctadecabacter jejudonensis]|nr:alpha/beta hydrolase [Pseudooctadecabacter jejudonensis]
MAIDELIERDWILLPGTLCTEDVFTPMLEAIGVPLHQRHAIRLDRPTIEDYAEVCTRSEGAVVCGFSLGAIVAAHLADRLKAARIILFGVNPLADDPAKAEGRRALAWDVIMKGGGAALDARLPPLNGARPDVARAKVLGMAERAAADCDAQTALALSRPGALGVLAKTECPVLVLTGTDDTMAPPELGRQAADAAPRGQFFPLTRLGHYALLESPAACAVALHNMEARLERAA